MSSEMQNLRAQPNPEVEDFLDEVAELAGDDPIAALQKVEAAPAALASHPDVRLVRADLTFGVSGPEAAAPLLRELVASEPEDPDARHMLACIEAELGNEDEDVAVGHFLGVLELDRAIEGDEPLPKEIVERIVKAAEGAFAKLPKLFQDRLVGVPILVEPRPSRELVAEGFDPRSLGLFEGPTDADRGAVDAIPAPTRIVLYTANLLADTVDDEELALEVETTVLHEVGHYFGLEEDDLDRIGLA
jgi:predicted Zn-dependent protease with MMP-like domain